MFLSGGCSNNGDGAMDMAVAPDMSVKKPGPIITDSAPCEGATVAPLKGSRQMIISNLTIGDFNEGFDFNEDGKVDNKLAPLGAVANPEITKNFTESRDIVVGIELFGYSGADTACAKFPFYIGRVNEDLDADGRDTVWEAGKSDCDDTNPAVKPGAAEVLDNGMDDDCDGFADNDKKGVKPTAPAQDPRADKDGDGKTIYDGDCDDRDDDATIKALAASRYSGAPEICGDGIDQDCDGIPDNTSKCDPFSGENKQKMHVQALSFSNAPKPFPANPITDAANLSPYIVFPNGKVTSGKLEAGPTLFRLNLPVAGFDLNLTLAATRLEATLTEKANGTHAEGLLGGVFEVGTLYNIHIDAGGILKKEQSLLDGIFAGPAGVILNLDVDKDGHYLPDADVDGDGLESFWASSEGNGPMAVTIVDRCKDGDGTVIEGADCPIAKDSNGKPRFVDGLTATLKFSAVPVEIVDVTEE